MNFFALLVWVLVLSWLTQMAASPQWRASNFNPAVLSAADALDPDQWVASSESASPLIDDRGDLYVGRRDKRWGSVKRRVPLVIEGSSSANQLYRLQATLSTDKPWSDRLSLNPGPVLHLYVDQGTRQYPFVARPMFFQSRVRIDTLVELRQQQAMMEIALIAMPGSNWRLSDLSLIAAREAPRYAHSFTALIALWGLTFLCGVVAAWRRARVPTLTVGLVVTLVLIGVLSSRTQVLQWFAYLSTEIRTVGGQITSGHFSAVMQSGHLVLFTGLTFLALSFHRRWWLKPLQIVSGIVVLAIATEALQNHAFGRSPDVRDFALDVIGIVVGAVLYWTLIGLKTLLVHKRWV